jgi:WD40 repeat protein
MWVRCVAFAPDGSFLAAGDQAGTISLWDKGAEWRPVRQWGHDSINPCAVLALAIAPDSRILATAFEDVRLWDLAPKADRMPKILKTAGACGCLAFNADGSLLAAGTHEGKVEIWDPATGTRRGQLPLPMGDRIRAVAFHPNGRHLALATMHRLLLWKLEALLDQ